MVETLIDGVAFSPATTLTVAITAEQTTATVATTANLIAPVGDRPGRCVVWDAAGHYETWDYTGLTPTGISGIIRGVEGTPYAFGADAWVARVPTAKDANAQNANIRALAAQGPIGIKWNRLADDTTEASLIDEAGNAIASLPFSSWDDYAIHRQIGRCLLSAAGVPSWGTNGRGDGLVLDGSSGPVMVGVPAVWFKARQPSANEFCFWVSSTPRAGYSLYPWFRSRGGTARDWNFIGAYPANLVTQDHPAHASATLVLTSKTGEQPVTGYQTIPKDSIAALPFTSGGTGTPTIGETLTGASSGVTAVICDWAVTSGSWAAGTAAGTFWVRQASGTFTNTEQLNGSGTGHTNIANAGVQAAVHLTMSQARGYAEAVGTGWGILSVHGLALLRLLCLMECGTFDAPSVVGKGTVDLASGTGFAGRVNGYGSADTQIGTNGTGVGLGTAGTTPAVWRGIEGLWGGVNQWIDGIESLDAAYRVIKRDGTGTFATPMAGGSYETATAAAPLQTTGFTSQLLWDQIIGPLFVAAAVAGSATTYVCDKHTGHTPGQTGNMVHGGSWASGTDAGLFRTDMSHPATYEARDLGCRLEYTGAI